MKKIKKEKLLLLCGISAWFVYLLNIIICSSLTPGYNHLSNLVSDLGRVENSYSGLFGVFFLLFAILYLTSSLGFYFSIYRITEKKVISVIIFLSTVLFSVSLIFTAIFPLPDIRHSGYGLGLFYDLTPLLIAIAFFKIPSARKLFFHQLIFFVLIMIMRSLNFGMFGLINESNIGLIQRLYVSVLIIWFTSTTIGLIKYKQK